MGDDCTRGDSTLGKGRLCASSALSMPCWVVVTPGMLASSEKVFEVGRDCRRRALVSDKIAQETLEKRVPVGQYQTCTLRWT